jgi:phage-related minor tail protein
MAAGFEIDKVKELLEGTKDAAKDLLAPIESAFESIVVNGGSARQVLQGLLSDITKILLRTQITKPLMGALDKAVSGSGGLAGLLGLFTKPSAEAIALASGIAPLASGGPMEAGHPYLVGEQGPELVVPKSAGTVIPNHALGGSSVYLTYNIAPGVSASQVMQALNATREQTKADIMESMRRGGAFARA